MRQYLKSKFSGIILVDSQNCSGSLEPHFIGNWFVTLQCKILHKFAKHLWGMSIHE